MSVRVSPTEKIRAEIDALFDGERELGEVIEDADSAAAFVALTAGGSESADAWGGFLEELRGRGLRPPLLVISDGAAGLINATESVLARSLRQKCLIHRARNVLAKVPAAAHDEVRGAYWAIFDTDALTAPGTGPGHKLVAAVQARIDAFAEAYGNAVPLGRQVPAHRPGAAHQLPALPGSSTTSGSGTPTSSSAPSARPAAGSRSSAGSPARPAASTSSGPSWTAPAEDGAA